uniref:Uncharacterized protein n=1 Tax=Arundo donax TaxID=35708 RepID=A0A0A9FIZ8_ARUDO
MVFFPWYFYLAGRYEHVRQKGNYRGMALLLLISSKAWYILELKEDASCLQLYTYIIQCLSSLVDQVGWIPFSILPVYASTLLKPVHNLCF